LFWLIKFKGNFVEYINYLNNISINQIFQPIEQDDILNDKIFENEVIDDQIIEEELSGLLEDDYFLPEAVLSGDSEVDYGFSGAFEAENVDNLQNDLSWSVSKEDLVNLIKSREK